MAKKKPAKKSGKQPKAQPKTTKTTGKAKGSFFKPVKRKDGAGDTVISILEELHAKTKEISKRRPQAIKEIEEMKKEGKRPETKIEISKLETPKSRKEKAKQAQQTQPHPHLEHFGPEVSKERVSTSRIARIKTGIPGLDEMTNGGFEQKSIILINGDPGSGKTNLGLQFLYEGALQGEAGLYISFGNEPRELLYPRLIQFGMDFQELEDKKLFFVIEYQPHEIAKLMQEEGGTIYDIITAYNVKRIVIDTITPYLFQFETLYDSRLALVRLFNVFRKFSATTVLLNEISQNLPMHPSAAIAEFLADGVINLIHSRSEDGIQVRGIEIWKLSGVSHTEIARPFAFTNKGIVIYPSERLFISSPKK